VEIGVEVFEVLDPGILTTVQDLGRIGYSQVGVPLSGALDPFSLRIGNLLVGNEEKEAGLEATIMGPGIKALREIVIAVAGGDLSPALNGEPLEMWKSHLLVEGDVFSFKGVRRGCRSYLAISGGIAVPRVMGSKSTFLSGKFGGLEGRPLRRGDRLRAGDLPIPLDKIGASFPAEGIPQYEREALLRVVPGPQDHHFTHEGLRTLQSSSYRVTAKSDRMGIRLEGPGIERKPEVEESIISEGLVPGAIQVPGDGKPMVILNELVTGGYTKIATIISVDLPAVAQLKPGDRVRFEPVALEEAHAFLRKQEERIERFRESLRNR
jgi:antagonist of KipI